jgi:resuscitation-promoting factor RpfB
VLVVNGVKQSPKQVSESVTKQPVNEVVSVGTKALPSSAADLNWTALATCESGDTPTEDTGNGFYGMYQFTVSTWDSLGGSGLPSDASAGTQTALAEKLYSEAGAGQWPVCGKNLFS